MNPREWAKKRSKDDFFCVLNKKLMVTHLKVYYPYPRVSETLLAPDDCPYVVRVTPSLNNVVGIVIGGFTHSSWMVRLLKDHPDFRNLGPWDEVRNYIAYTPGISYKVDLSPVEILLAEMKTIQDSVIILPD